MHNERANRAYIWRNTLKIFYALRPLPFIMTPNFIDITWNNKVFPVCMRENSIYDHPGNSYILVGTPHHLLPKSSKIPSNFYIPTINLSLLEKMVRYYYEKELGIYKINHQIKNRRYGSSTLIDHMQRHRSISTVDQLYATLNIRFRFGRV